MAKKGAAGTSDHSGHSDSKGTPRAEEDGPMSVQSKANPGRTLIFSRQFQLNDQYKGSKFATRVALQTAGKASDSGKEICRKEEADDTLSSTERHLYKTLHFKDFEGKCLGFKGKVAQGSRGFFDMGRRSQISEGTINTARKSKIIDMNQDRGPDSKHAIMNP